MTTLQAWHDFFILTGTAAATLLGLVFVAASIAAAIPNEKLGNAGAEDVSGSLWVVPIVYAFLRVLIVSAVGVIPGQSWHSFGVVLSLLALFDLGRIVRVTAQARQFHRSREKLTLGDWGWYVVYPSGASLLLAAMGLSLAMGWALPLAALPIGMLVHLVVGVHNAWELAAWLATRQ
ncbi:MAG: hypothetical protein ABSE49_04150 [Polyangiaceae bacterium]